MMYEFLNVLLKSICWIFTFVIIMDMNLQFYFLFQYFPVLGTGKYKPDRMGFEMRPYFFVLFFCLFVCFKTRSLFVFLCSSFLIYLFLIKNFHLLPSSHFPSSPPTPLRVPLQSKEQSGFHALWEVQGPPPSIQV